MTASPRTVFVAVSHGDGGYFFVFGSAGWRGKIDSQGMVNKYSSPQQEGPHSFTSGRGECVFVCAGTCVHAFPSESLCAAAAIRSSHTPSVCTQRAALLFLNLQHGGGEGEKEMTRLGELLWFVCS